VAQASACATNTYTRWSFIILLDGDRYKLLARRFKFAPVKQERSIAVG